MQLNEHQRQVAQDNHRFRVLRWGRKSGKTELSIEEMLGFALVKSPHHNKNPKISYIGETRKEAKRIAWDRAKSRSKTLWYKKPNESNLELYIRIAAPQEGGPEFSTIFFDGWENISALIGEEFDFLVLDEVAKYRNFWTGWNEVLRPTLGPRKGATMFISRPQGYNHFFDLDQMELQVDNYKSFHATAYDNVFVDASEIDEAKKELPDATFAQEYLAEYKKKEGLVYSEFNRDKHLMDDNEKEHMKLRISDWYAGVDFGYTNPTVILTIGRDHDGNFYIFDEWVKTKKTNAEMIEWGSTLSINAWYPDPAEPDRIKEMKSAGMNCREVNKDIEKGIDTVRNLIKNGKVKVWNKCLATISEFEMYSYPESRNVERNNKENPEDANNHCMDALRYVLFMLSSVSQSRTAVVHYPQNNKPLSPVARSPQQDQPKNSVSVHYPSRRKP